MEVNKQMDAKQLWYSFINIHSQYKNAPYTAWQFGTEADLLAELTAKGIKTATTSGYDLYEREKESLPLEGEFNVILNQDNQAVCITQTIKVYVVPFKEVTREHAYKEGEGDRSLDYWRKVHIEFFTKYYTENDVTFNDDSLVVCEEFEVIYPK